MKEILVKKLIRIDNAIMPISYDLNDSFPKNCILYEKDKKRNPDFDLWSMSFSSLIRLVTGFMNRMYMSP